MDCGLTFLVFFVRCFYLQRLDGSFEHLFFYLSTFTLQTHDGNFPVTSRRVFKCPLICCLSLSLLPLLRRKERRSFLSHYLFFFLDVQGQRLCDLVDKCCWILLLVSFTYEENIKRSLPFLLPFHILACLRGFYSRWLQHYSIPTTFFSGGGGKGRHFALPLSSLIYFFTSYSPVL